MRKLRVVILCHNDLTSNLIFGPLVDSKKAEILAIFLQSSPDRSSNGLVRGALGVLRKTSFKFWTFLMSVNIIHLILSHISSLFRINLRIAGHRLLRRAAQAQKVRIESVSDFNDTQFLDHLRSLEPDIVLIRIGTILRLKFLLIPKFGTFCIHSSLLPSFGGIAAEFHAMRLSESSFGTTIFRVSEQLDRGDILLQACPLTFNKSCLMSAIVENNVAASHLLLSFVDSIQRDPGCFKDPLKPTSAASYFSWPTGQQVNEFRVHKLRFFCSESLHRLFSNKMHSHR